MYSKMNKFAKQLSSLIPELIVTSFIGDISFGSHGIDDVVKIQRRFGCIAIAIELQSSIAQHITV